MFFEIYENNIHLAVDKTSDGTLLLNALDASTEPATPIPEAVASAYMLANIRITGANPAGYHIGKLNDGTLSGQFAAICREHILTRNHFGLCIRFIQQSGPLEIASVFQFFDGIAAVSSHTELRNLGEKSIGIDAAAAFFMNRVVPTPLDQAQNVYLTAVRGGWSQEYEIDCRPLAAWGLRNAPGVVFRRAALGNSGTFAAKEYFPVGMIEDRHRQCGMLWQIESGTNWYWEVSESYQKSLYLYLSGGNDRDHQSYHEIAAGEMYATPECTLVPFDSEFNQALDALTECRRRKRLSPAVVPPLAFNDYMSIWADPSTEKILPLVEKAAELNADIYLIDAGWYGKDFWWDCVGEWREEPSRFPNGLAEITTAIRKHGMRPGIWIEIERMGINCPLARQWPDECFFCRHGRRVIENASYQLDFRHPMVRKHIESTLERLIHDLGIVFFKFDYNIEIGVGTEIHAESPEAGLEAHQQAYFTWFDAFRDSHPDIGFENCASGGMRNTQPYLSRCTFASVTDNINLRETARIALTAPLVIPPEQCGLWVAPRKDSTMDDVTAILTASLLLVPNFSGDVRNLPAPAWALMKEAAELYRTNLGRFIRNASPWYPVGIPSRDAECAAFGMRQENQIVLGVWNFATQDAQLEIPLPDDWRTVKTTVLFPAAASLHYLPQNSAALKFRLAGNQSMLLQIDK